MKYLKGNAFLLLLLSFVTLSSTTTENDAVKKAEDSAISSEALKEHVEKLEKEVASLKAQVIFFKKEEFIIICEIVDIAIFILLN